MTERPEAERLAERTTPWRVSIDDTGGEFSGWPSIVACDEADIAIVHRAGFKQEYWSDLSQRDAVAAAHLIVDAINGIARLQHRALESALATRDAAIRALPDAAPIEDTHNDLGYTADGQPHDPT